MVVDGQIRAPDETGLDTDIMEESVRIERIGRVAQEYEKDEDKGRRAKDHYTMM